MDKRNKTGAANQAVIYGAQIYAASFYESLTASGGGPKILCFLVTNRDKNPEQIDGIPVLELDSAPDELRSVPVFIATPEFHHEEIRRLLTKKGYTRIETVTADKQEELLTALGKNASQREGRPFETVRELCKATPKKREEAFLPPYLAYQVRCVHDKPLNTSWERPEWILPVQGGSALTTEKLCSLTDRDGAFSISEKNASYCELSTAYWIWKNRLDHARYTGLFHYRRYLDVTPDQIEALAAQNVEAILPYPMRCYPDTFSHHTRFVKELDWDRMMLVLGEKYPEYLEAAERVWSGREIYVHNIWILRKDRAEDFLAWLFDILLEMENRWESRELPRTDRHMGYLGENLTTLYFLHHRDRIRIAHAGERILS